MPPDLQRLTLARAEVRLELALAKDGKAPTEFRIFKFGSNPTENGVVLLDEEGARSAMEWAEKYGNKLHINYNHCGRSPSCFPIPPPDPAEAFKAAGQFKLGRRDDGLWAEQVQWTPVGKQKVEDKEFLYTSPEIWMEEQTNRLLIVDGCAITNTPATWNLVPLVASRGGAPAPPHSGGTGHGDTPMGIELKALLTHALLSADTAEHVALGAVGDNARAVRDLLSATGAKSPADALAHVADLARASRTLLSVTGAKTVDEAQGVVDAWKASAAEADRLKVDLAKQDGEAVAGRMRSLLDAAGKPDEKGRVRVSPAEREWAEKEYGLVGADKPPTKVSEERLKGYLANKAFATAEAATPPAPNGQQAPGTPPPAAGGAGQERATYEGKVWAEIPHKTLHELFTSNRPLYDQLKADHERKTGRRLSA